MTCQTIWASLPTQTSPRLALPRDEIGKPKMLTFVSEEDGQLIGFAQLKWEAARACVPGMAPGEIQPSWHRIFSRLRRFLMEVVCSVKPRDTAWAGGSPAWPSVCPDFRSGLGGVPTGWFHLGNFRQTERLEIFN